MPTVLIADDDPHLRLLVAATLSASGWRLLEAADGDDAWTLLNEERPEVAVLDVMMPGKDGLELVHMIRQEPAVAGMRVILLTGRDEPEDARQGRRAGADLYLTKPFSPVTLLHAVTCDFAIEDAGYGAVPRQSALHMDTASSGTRPALTVQAETSSGETKAPAPPQHASPPAWPTAFVDVRRLWQLLGHRDVSALADPTVARQVANIERRLADAYVKGIIKRYVARDPANGAVIAHAYRRDDIHRLFAHLNSAQAAKV